jgi:hypothetical protein
MLLLAPVTWEHSFVLLILPVAIFWADSPAGSRQRRLLVLLSLVLLINPALFYPLCRTEGPPAGSRVFCSAPQVLVVLSLQCYALCSLFAVALWHGKAAQAAAGASTVPAVLSAQRKAA